MPFDRTAIQTAAARLAQQGVYIGTSSWKYEGWFDQLYTPARYEYRGKVAKTRFQRECLSEYAEFFKTVCVDAAYYTFPSQKYLEAMAAQVTPDFRFAFKVTDEITIKKFPNLDRFGDRAGKRNENFLNADLFVTSFLGPCDHIRPPLKAELPEVQVTQLQVTHPGADDDGLWFITVAGRGGEVQIESSHGSCPFLIESDFSDERFDGHTVDEVVSIVRRLYA